MCTSISAVGICCYPVCNWFPTEPDSTSFLLSLIIPSLQIWSLDQQRQRALWTNCSLDCWNLFVDALGLLCFICYDASLVWSYHLHRRRTFNDDLWSLLDFDNQIDNFVDSWLHWWWYKQKSLDWNQIILLQTKGCLHKTRSSIIQRMLDTSIPPPQLYCQFDTWRSKEALQEWCFIRWGEIIKECKNISQRWGWKVPPRFDWNRQHPRPQCLFLWAWYPPTWSIYGRNWTNCPVYNDQCLKCAGLETSTEEGVLLIPEFSQRSYVCFRPQHSNSIQRNHRPKTSSSHGPSRWPRRITEEGVQATDALL